MRTVIIVGTGSPWPEAKAPGDEIWGVNFAFTKNALDRLYFFDSWDRLVYWGKSFPEQIADLGLECWSVLAHPEVPGCRAFPVRELVDTFALARRETTLIQLALEGKLNLSCTVAYMIAHACLEHKKGRRVDKLVIHGILVSPGSKEYYGQKEAMDFWLGVATGLGIPLEFTGRASWLRRSAEWLPSLYGFEERGSWEDDRAYNMAITNTIRQVHVDIRNRQVPRRLTPWGRQALEFENVSAG